MSEVLIESLKDGVLTLTMNRPEARNALNLEMSDRMVEALGAETVVHTREGDGSSLLAVLSGQHGLASGDEIGLAFDPALVHAFDAAGWRLKGN